MITTFRIEELIEKIQDNRNNHRAIFEEAVEGYKKKAVELLEQHIERINHGDLVNVYVSLPRPEDHTKDYDRVLMMLSMSTDSHIDLEETDFAMYVMDDWHWKRQFLATNSAYSLTATETLKSYET